MSKKIEHGKLFHIILSISIFSMPIGLIYWIWFGIFGFKMFLSGLIVFIYYLFLALIESYMENKDE